MALDPAPKLFKQSIVAFALETTTGVAAAISASDGVTPIFNASSRFNTELVERQSQGNLSRILQGLGARAAAIEFETELFGPDTAIWTRLLRACGCTIASKVVTPITGATETVTINHYRAGRLRQIVGAMGNCVITFARGKAARARWTFTGVQGVQPTDAAILSPTHVSTIAPRMGGTATIGGVGYCAPDAVLDFGNTVALRECMSATDTGGEATGYKNAYIADRNPTVRIAPEAQALATKDWANIFANSTTSAMALVLGRTSENNMTLAAPKLQLIADPEDTDRGGMLADALTLAAIRNSDAGDDEWSLTFADAA